MGELIQKKGVVNVSFQIIGYVHTIWFILLQPALSDEWTSRHCILMERVSEGWTLSFLQLLDQSRPCPPAMAVSAYYIYLFTTTRLDADRGLLSVYHTELQSRKTALHAVCGTVSACYLVLSLDA